MSRYMYILRALAEPWLITSEGYDTVASLVRNRIERADTDLLTIAKDTGGLFGDAPTMTIDRGTGIAEIPVCGTIGKGLSGLEKSCGGCCTEELSTNIQTALNDPAVKGILLNIDSPGGTVNGTPEVANRVREACASKPVVAFTDGLMASAAYWIGSQADMVVASQSANLGSIGVYIPFVDQSKRAAMMGIKVDVIKNADGTFKGMGHPGTELSTDQRAQIQAHVDEIFSMFKGDVCGKRPGVCTDAMRGQTFLGSSAKKMGLCDDVGSISHARATLSGLIKMRK